MLSNTLTRHRILSDLPNISIALAEALRRVGVTSPQALIELGAERAWTLLERSGIQRSIQLLLALEGSITGISWHAIPHDRRAELVRFAAQQPG